MSVNSILADPLTWVIIGASYAFVTVVVTVIHQLRKRRAAA